MDNLKFVLFSIFVLALLGFSGYWAFSTIESGSTHVDSQELKESEQKNEEFAKEVAQLKREISLLQSEKEAQLQKEQEILASNIPEVPTPVVTPTPTPTKTTVYKYQSLIDDLQKLVNSKIYLKNKSQGPAVGTLQKFLNIYNNTSTKVDNDYGTSTATAVKAFQKAQGLTQDGEVGPGTFSKMIIWLKSH
jgi:murein L,D-transpeptidase YcbB/YkuD